MALRIVIAVYRLGRNDIINRDVIMTSVQDEIIERNKKHEQKGSTDTPIQKQLDCSTTFKTQDVSNAEGHTRFNIRL